jgi:hypothetical protein
MEEDSKLEIVDHSTCGRCNRLRTSSVPYCDAMMHAKHQLFSQPENKHPESRGSSSSTGDGSVESLVSHIEIDEQLSSFMTEPVESFSKESERRAELRASSAIILLT